MTRESAIYEGTLTHARHGPRAHAFAYDVYLLYLDLDELPELLAGPGPLRAGRFGLLSFHRPDYLGGAADLAAAARAWVTAALGFTPRGPVRLLTHARSLGYVFNPVSFYYCFAEDGRTLEAVVAEITNTPWGERHAYVVRATAGGAWAELAKGFHVSPFFGMEQTYRWRLEVPGERLAVEMRNEEGAREVFRARLALHRRPWSAAALWRAALLQPLMAWKVHAAIYWQALRLWTKRVPFHPHPAKSAALAARRS
ncbi:MAG TPA: DUF1365 domain-containing protein [Anaeromyxobacteraceae bacterium]|nr:DUF1365 domain-containing protein [Anaeromyxobacteraceae bacterium]